VNTATLTAPDSQRAVLGSLLVTNSLMHAVELTTEDFSGTPDRAIYKEILKKWGEGEPFDVGTIASGLNGQLDSVGGPAYLGTLIDGAVPDPGLVRVHVKSIRQFSKLRRLALLAEDLSKESRNLGADPDQLLAMIENVTCSLRSDHQAPESRHPELLKLSDVQARAVDWLWQPYLALGMLGMLSGDPGAGKTFISMAIAVRSVAHPTLANHVGRPMCCTSVSRILRNMCCGHVLICFRGIHPAFISCAAQLRAMARILCAVT
jgi:hypothetical protein